MNWYKKSQKEYLKQIDILYKQSGFMNWKAFLTIVLPSIAALLIGRLSFPPDKVQAAAQSAENPTQFINDIEDMALDMGYDLSQKEKISKLVKNKIEEATAQQPSKVVEEKSPNKNDALANKIAWGSKLSPDEKRKVIEISMQLGINPDYLMAVMAFETGGAFSSNVTNMAGSGATGLIQFMPSTAESLGTSTDDLSKMGVLKQLDYVYKYLKPYSGRMSTLTDAYMAVLYPRAIGKGDGYVLFTSPSRAYKQNRGLDTNKDGKVTAGEAASRVRTYLNTGLKSENAG